MPVNIQVSPALELRIRLRVLHDTVRELASGFGADNPALEIISKGILERRLLAAVYVYYLNDAGGLLGYFKLAINWARHQLHAESDESGRIRIDPRQPISQQITQAFPIMVRHSQRFRREAAVKCVEVRFTYRDEIYQDSRLLNEARAYLGTEMGPERTWATPPERSGGSPVYFTRYCARSMDELTVSGAHDKSILPWGSPSAYYAPEFPDARRHDAQ